MSNVVEIQAAQVPTEVQTIATGTAALILDGQSLDRMMKLAEIMASSRVTLPNEYKNNPGDCLAVVMQSMQWRMNPYAVAQKTHFINGKIGYEAQLIHAAILTSGFIGKDGFEYEWYGPWDRVIGKFEIKKGDKGEYRVPGWKLADEEGIGIRIRASIAATGTVRELDLLLAQARTRNSTLWADDPRQQLSYLAEKRWARLYCPHVILGAYTPDELREAGERDMGAAEVVPDKPTVADRVKAATGHAPAKPPPTVKAPTLDAVLHAIKAAVTTEDMAAAGDLCARIADAADKDIARAAYRDRMAALKQAAAAAKDAQTKPTTYAEVADAINGAKDADALALALDLIRSVPDEAQQAELRGLADGRLADFATGT